MSADPSSVVPAERYDYWLNEYGGHTRALREVWREAHAAGKREAYLHAAEFMREHRAWSVDALAAPIRSWARAVSEGGVE